VNKKLIRGIMAEQAIRGLPRRRAPSADLVNRVFHRDGPNQLWMTDIERHEALPNPAVAKGHRQVLVAAGALKLRQPDPRGRGEGGQQPGQRRDGSALADGPGPASEMDRRT
jgi:hypothetical protein